MRREYTPAALSPLYLSIQGADHCHGRPTVRGSSTNSAAEGDVAKENAGTVYGDSSDRYNAKIIGYTKEGDVIIRVSPEVSQDLGQVKAQSSIRWHEPGAPPVPPVPHNSVERSSDHVKEADVGTPRSR